MKSNCPHARPQKADKIMPGTCFGVPFMPKKMAMQTNMIHGTPNEPK